MLAPGLVDHDGHRVGKVQAPAALAHGQAQALFLREPSQHGVRQAAGLRPEQQGIAIAEGRGIKAHLPTCGDCEDPAGLYRFPPLFEAVILLHPGQLVIVESGAARPRAVQLETERMDQMERRPGVGRQTNNITRVRRDFRFIKDDVKHD